MIEFLAYIAARIIAGVITAVILADGEDLYPCCHNSICVC